ncbi:MAG TPA: hypothetical protein VGL86_19675 [Polyangia bacterium]
METRGVAEAALLGMAAGMRSMVPLAALGLTLPRRRLFFAPLTLASAAELVYDKLPQASDRAMPGPLSARVGAGAIAGGIAAYVLGASIPLAAATGALTALGSTLLFRRVRAAAARRVPPPAAAVGEDLVAIGTAAVALRVLERD